MTLENGVKGFSWRKAAATAALGIGLTTSAAANTESVDVSAASNLDQDPAGVNAKIREGMVKYGFGTQASAQSTYDAIVAGGAAGKEAEKRFHDFAQQYGNDIPVTFSISFHMNGRDKRAVESEGAFHEDSCNPLEYAITLKDIDTKGLMSRATALAMLWKTDGYHDRASQAMTKQARKRNDHNWDDYGDRYNAQDRIQMKIGDAYKVFDAMPGGKFCTTNKRIFDNDLGVMWGQAATSRQPYDDNAAVKGRHADPTTPIMATNIGYKPIERRKK